MIAGLFLTLFGGILTWTAVLNWRHRHAERISIAEAVILKITGEQPLPLTRIDRALQWFQIVVASILGPPLLLAGLALLFDQLGISK
jgi:hypothetical protein